MKVSTYTPNYNGPLAIVYTDVTSLAANLNEAQLERVHSLGERYDEKWLELQNGAQTTWIYKVKNDLDANARAEKMRQAGNSLCLKVNGIFADRVAILGAHAAEISEGAILGNYQFLKYFSDHHKRRNSLV